MEVVTQVKETTVVKSAQNTLRPYVTASIFYLVSRLIFLYFNRAEFTDGYQLISWEFFHPVRWHPLYPLLIKSFPWFVDPVIAGRLVSIFAGLAAMIVLAQTARMLYGIGAARWACLIYIANPMLYWTNIRVLTESLFQLLFFLAIFYFIKFHDSRNPRSAMWFLFFSGLAMLTRPEGVILAPVVLLLFVFFLRLKDFRSILKILPAAFPWMLYALWSAGLKASTAYHNEMAFNVAILDLPRALTFLILYIDTYPYVTVYPIFLFGVFHLFTRAPGAWKRTALYVHLAWGLLLFLHTAWSTRFVFIPMSFLIVEAGAGMREYLAAEEKNRRRHAALYTVIVCSFVFAVFGIVLQRDMFADMRQAALTVRYNLGSHRVVSDEQVKTSYYLGRDIVPYKRSLNFRAGDVVVLHSYHVNLRAEAEFLREQYRCSVYHSSKSEIVPLLGNALIAERGFTNSPVAAVERFKKQRFQSVVLVIEGKNQRAP